ncbi:MAG: chemotaxis protein CheW [Gammaproteobacteria bacterium]|nr:chemotaxis protein CheW [Gammaproteobacteria bacterium]
MTPPAKQQATEERPDANAEQQLMMLQFHCQNQLFGIALSKILRVIHFSALQNIPGTPNYLAGLLNLHGQSLPVYDLALRLKLTESTAYTINTPIILCEHQQHRLGLIVDEIIGVENIPQVNLTIDKLTKNKIGEFLIGSSQTRYGPSLVINADTLLAEGSHYE